jgi:16S rRNA processing protein RimM
MPSRSQRQLKTQQKGPSPQGGGPSFLAVARIRRPHGVKGELLIDLLTKFPRQLMDAGDLYLDGLTPPLRVVSLRRHGRDMLLQLEDIVDRDRAETLGGQLLYVRTDNLPPLPPGVYYLYQIEGLEVWTDQGDILGRIKEVLKTGANDVYVVSGPKGEVLLPAIPDVIRDVNLNEKKMTVHLLDGLAAE